MTTSKMKMKICLIKKQVFVFLLMKVFQPFSGDLTSLLMDKFFCFRPAFGKRTLSLNSNIVPYFIERIS
jgi:hypothetical protein